MKMNHTRNALFTSVLALLLCVSMLVGTTFAWFTDSVTSATNTITAGNLDIQLFHDDKATTADEEVGTGTVLFDDVALWEPGAMVYEKLTVKNNGSLALKYSLAINIKEVSVVNGKSLADVLKIAVMDVEPTRENIKTAATQDLATFQLNGELLTNGSTKTYYVAIYWAPSANDNDYNVPGKALNAKLGVNLVATQYTAESDSFDDQYDKDAVVSVVSGGQAVTLTVNDAPSAITKKTTVDVPADVFNDGDEVSIIVGSTNTLYNISNSSGDIATLSVTLSVNEANVHDELPAGEYYTVTTHISTGLDENDIVLTYNGDRSQYREPDPVLVSYDAATGELVFKTTHFSQFKVSAKAVAFDTEKDTAYLTTAEVVEALKSEEAKVEIAEDLTASQKVELSDAIEEAGDEIKADTTVVEDINSTLDVASITKVGDFAALKAAVEAGGTILLSGNIETAETLYITKDVEIDGNGFTLTYNGNGAAARAISAESGVGAVKLNLANLTILCPSSYCQRGINFNTNGTLTLKNVTIDGTWLTYAVNLPGSSDNAVVNITDSKITGNFALNIWGENAVVNVTNTELYSVGSSSNDAYSAIALNTDGENGAENAVVTVTGGKITSLYNDGVTPCTAVRNTTATGKVNVSDNTPVVGVFKTMNPIVMVTYPNSNQFYAYASLQDAVNKAIKDAKLGAVVKLGGNITFETAVNIVGDVVIDLNGFTATVTGDREKLFYVNTDDDEPQNINVTIKNGKLVAESTNHMLNGTGTSTGASSCVYFVSTGKLIMTDVEIQGSVRGGHRAIEVYCGEAELTNVDIVSYYGSGVNAGDDAKVVLNDCDITVNGMYSAPYNSTCFSVMSGGELTINSGNYKLINDNVYATGDTHGGWVGIVMNSGGTITINGGTYTNVPTEGFVPQYERAIIEAENLDPATATVNLFGGTFIPQNNKVVSGYGDVNYPVINGVLTDNGDGTWTASAE